MQEGEDHIGLDYVSNKDAPVFRVHGLHDLQILVVDGVFELYRLKRTPGGVLYRETELFVEVPLTAVTPGVALTTRKVAGTVIGQAVDTAARALRLN